MSRDSETSLDGTKVRNIRRAEVSRLVRGTLERRAGMGVKATNNASNEEKTSRVKEVQIDKLPPVGHKKERNAVFKVICPDTGDLWKMLVVPGENLNGFAGRVRQKTGRNMILFVDDEALASEEDWKAVKGGGRIVARLAR